MVSSAVAQGGGSHLIGLFLTVAIVMAVIAAITGRHLNDDGAWRPRAIYLSVAMLPILLVTAVATAVFLSAVVQLILGPETPVRDALGGLLGGNLGELTDAAGDLPSGLGGLLEGLAGGLGVERSDLLARQAVVSGLTAVAGAFLYWLHLGWRRALLDEEGFASSAASRILQAFAYTVTFVFVVVFLVAAVRAGYGLFRVIAPGMSAGLEFTESADRERGVAEFIAAGGLAIAAYWLATMHWTMATRLRNPESAQPPETPIATTPPEPTSP